MSCERVTILILCDVTNSVVTYEQHLGIMKLQKRSRLI